MSSLFLIGNLATYVDRKMWWPVTIPQAQINIGHAHCYRAQRLIIFRFRNMAAATWNRGTIGPTRRYIIKMCFYEPSADNPTARAYIHNQMYL